MDVRHLHTLAEFQVALESRAGIVVGFTAPWCEPCKTIFPIFKVLLLPTAPAAHDRPSSLIATQPLQAPTHDFICPDNNPWQTKSTPD